jgi:hypothetical protein
MKAVNTKSLVNPRIAFIMKSASLLLLTLLMFFVSACAAFGSTESSSSETPQQGSTSLNPVSQTHFQHLPEGLLNPNHPVLDRVFGYKCGLAAYQASPHNAMAVTGDGWVIPETGEVVTGGNNSCDVTGLAGIAHQYGAKSFLTLGVDASQHTPKQLATYLQNAVNDPSLLDIIVSKAVNGHYDGVILDYETVDGSVPGIDKTFQQYCIKLREKLQAQSPALTLGIDMIHKTSDNDPFNNLNAFENWRLLGQDGVCDFIIMMSLDEHLGKPGAGVEWSWVNDQVQYLEKTMPQALPKVIWLLPLYGYKWQEKSDGTWALIDGDVSCPYAMNIPSQGVNVISKVDDPPFLEYSYSNNGQTVHRKLWYNTTASLLNIISHLQQAERDFLHDPTFKVPVSFWYRGDECSNLDSQLAQFYAA